MNSTEIHKKYIRDLSTLMDDSGSEMRNFVMRTFKQSIQNANSAKSFVVSVRSLKPRLVRALSKKAKKYANKSFMLGKNFLETKIK